MSTKLKEILIGLLYVIAIISFDSGQYIVSTILFAGTTILTNVVMRTR
jgi:hypothetical protein